jgi:hypothetical protein
MWSHLVKAVILSIVLDSVPTQSATSGSAVVPTTVTITVTATVCSSNTFFTSYRSSTTSSCINPTVVTEGYTLTGFVEVTPTVQSTVSPTPTLMNYEVAPRVVIGHRITWIEIAQPIDQRASVENTCQFQCGGLCKSFFVYYCRCHLTWRDNSVSTNSMKILQVVPLRHGDVRHSTISKSL